MTAFIIDSLESYITKDLKIGKFLVYQKTIVKECDIILSKGFGVVKVSSTELVDENTLFLIGSNTDALFDLGYKNLSTFPQLPDLLKKVDSSMQWKLILLLKHISGEDCGLQYYSKSEKIEKSILKW